MIDAQNLEEFVLAEVREQWEANYAVTLGDRLDKASADDIAARLAEARAELDAFANDLSARRLLGDSYHAALESRANAVAALEEEWNELDARREEEEATEISWWDTLEPDELRGVLGGAIDAVFVRRGRARGRVALPSCS